MFYIKNMWRSVRDNPITYIIYLITVVLSVFVTCIFYRLTKQQIIYLDFSTAQFDYSLLVPIAMGISVIAISSINVFCAYNYITSKNMYKLVMYKMVGAKNTTIIMAMSIETLITIAFAFFFAITIEYPIAQPIIDFSFARLTAIDYFYVFLINLTSVFLTLGVKILKVSLSPIANKKTSGE